MSVLLQTLASSLKNLNGDLDVKDDGVVMSNCGTFALIDRAINDLAAVRTALKTAEKQVESVICTELLLSGGAVQPSLAVAATTSLNAHDQLDAADEQVNATSEVLRESAAALIANPKSASTELNTPRGVKETTNQNIGFKIGKDAAGAATGQAFTEAHLVNVLADIYCRIRSLLNGSVAVAGSVTSKD